MIRLFLIGIIAVLMLQYTTGEAKTTSEFYQEGEELTYEVSYFGIKLGSIKVYSKKKMDLGGREVYNVECEMKTYSGIPFVDLHAIFEGWTDRSFSYSRKFIGRTKESDTSWSYQKISYDYDKGEIEQMKWINKVLIDSSKFESKKKWNDGISLFFLARKYAKRSKSYKIPTIINDDTCYTTINFRNKIEDVEIDAVDYPVNTVYFDGLADWEGVYGVTGIFEGWFSNDEASVPIMAKMKVIVGKVKIELIEWKRKGWSPPKKS